MNANLTRLLELINARRQIEQAGELLTRDALIDALAMISASYSLEAVALYCGRLVALARQKQHEGLRRVNVRNFERRLAILEELSIAASQDAHFKCSHQREDSDKPLWGYTGDGPICDALLINAAVEADNGVFERILVWFVWLCLLYHERYLPLEVYRTYLDGNGDQKARICKVNEAAAALMPAGVAIRKLASADYRDARVALTSFDLMLDKAQAKQMAEASLWLMRVKSISDSLVMRWNQLTGRDPQTARQQLEALNDDTLKAIGRFLRRLWGEQADRKSSVSNRHHRERNDYLRPSVRRYKGQIVAQVYTTEAESDEGLVIELSELASREARYTPAKDEWVDPAEDVDEPDGEPLVRLYIGTQKDFVSSYYAAKGAQYAMEYQNASLPWKSSRLGQSGVRALKQVLAVGSASDRFRAGKLLIALSLLTGRSLKEVGKTRIDTTCLPHKNEDGLVIDLATGRLHLLAATPEVHDRAGGVGGWQALRHPHATHLSLQLPSWILALANESAGMEGALSAERNLKAARELLASLPHHWQINEAAIRDALVLHLQEQCGGDLGLIKLITDRQALNLNNIIHYAAYELDEANGAWVRALSALLDEPVEPIKDDEGVPQPSYVGSPDALNRAAISEELTQLKQRLKESLTGNDEIRAYNLMTIYTLLWCNLALASRARCAPAPFALIGEMAVVSDKHREDGSAERLVPLTTNVMDQLRRYFDWVWQLSFRLPALAPIKGAFEQGVIPFRFITAKGEVVSYRPKWLYQNEKLIPLPGNWGRKVVRQALTDIGGRFLDAGMGHWVVGRHPYRLTSNFSVGEFQRQWLGAQVRLENELGFEVIAPPAITSPFAWPQPIAISRDPDRQTRKSKPTEKERDFDAGALMKEVEPALYQAIAAENNKDPRAVAGLIQRTAIHHLHDEKESLRQMTEACCDWARRKWKVPIFAERPRPQFSKDWLINREALHNLAFFTQQLLPAFERDIMSLPAPDHTEAGELRDLGRFVMLCIWRQGLVTWPVLKAFIKGYLEQGILATGNMRYVPITVSCRRNGAVMQRLAYLEPYAQVYLVLEYPRLRKLLSCLSANSQQRRNQLQQALWQYLSQFMTNQPGYLLTATFEAAAQYHLLRSSPVLAAYARAEFDTHDLNDKEVRHLSGMAAHRQGADATQPTPMRSQGATTEAVALPSELLTREQDLVYRISHKRSPDVVEMERQIQAEKINNRLEGLLQCYAVWTLQHESRTKKGKLVRGEKARFQQHVSVVGYSLLGMTGRLAGNEQADSGFTLDEAFLQDMEEQFREWHPHEKTTDAYQSLRHFLRQKSGRDRIKKLGVQLADIEPGRSKGVLAKLVKTSTVEQVGHLIGRVDQSGIARFEGRQSAQRHLALVSLYGMRRTEAEGLREKDVQGDIIRVQAYDQHRLKTRWSNRVLPRALADQADMDWLAAVTDSESSLIATGLPQKVDGYNYFPAVNHLIQQVAGDPGVHLHSLRHSTASRLALSVLTDSVEFERIADELPWVKALLLPQAQVDTLLGGEGQSGHGLQAIASLLGHSHPTTTLRHYMHTMGIAFYAHLCSLPSIDSRHAFLRRHHETGHVRTHYRRLKRWQAESADMEAGEQAHYLQRQLREFIEQLVPAPVSKEPGEVVFVEKEGEAVSDSGEQGTVPFDGQVIQFARLDELDQILRGQAPSSRKLDMEGIEKRLNALFDIPGGKRGDKTKRHPCESVAGKKLPQRPVGRSAVQAASLLCDWLETLRKQDRERFHWLLGTWKHKSRRITGRMQLDDKDLPQWKCLPETERVRPEIKETIYRSKGKGRKDRKEVAGQLCCLKPDGEPIKQDAQAVRWVMTWVAALC